MSFSSVLNARLQGDRVIWMIVLLLSVFSILTVYSATGTIAYKMGASTTSYVFKHVVLIGLSWVVIYGCYQVKYERFNQVAPWVLALSIPLLFTTLFFGTEINDARRWLTIPGVKLTFQTSDLAKLALVTYVARTITKHKDYIKDFKEAFVPIIVPILIVCLLIAPADLSTALMLFLTCLLLMFIGRVNLRYVGMLLLLGVVFFALLLAVGKSFPEFVRVDTWIERFNAFVNNVDGGGYQIRQSKIAIAEGGLLGHGPGNSVQRNFLPHPYSDFIFAIIIEEYGLIGGITIIGLYVLLFFRCVRIFGQGKKAFGALLAVGLSLMLVIQALANVAVSVNMVPVTGLTLPLMSMGGTSLLFSSIAVGMILSVSQHMERVGAIESED